MWALAAVARVDNIARCSTNSKSDRCRRSLLLGPASERGLVEQQPAAGAVVGQLAPLDQVVDRALGQAEVVGGPFGVEEAVVAVVLEDLRDAPSEELELIGRELDRQRQG